MSEHALRAEGLHKSYPGGRGRDAARARDGLGVEVPRGTRVGRRGPHGAGPSTKSQVVGSATRADSGTAVVDDIDVARRPGAVRARIGLVSQRPSSDPMATGRENLVLAGRIQGLSRAEARSRADRLLDRFTLGEAADRLVKTWSGGMSRKLDVAIGLIHRPAVLFLDEPTTGLDPHARAEMWAEIDRLGREEEATVLLTTHYLDEADRLADTLAIVEAGQVKVHGTPEELKSELRGDSIVVELVDAGQGARAATGIGAVPGVREVSVTDSALRARADGGARTVPLVLARLDELGVAVSSATVARPSLDDVYLRHVGRSLGAVA